MSIPANFDDMDDVRLAALSARVLHDMVTQMSPDERQRYRDALDAADAPLSNLMGAALGTPDTSRPIGASTHADTHAAEHPHFISFLDDCLCISRCNWFYPHATENDAGLRDDTRYCAIDKRDGDIVISLGGLGHLDLAALRIMLGWKQPASRAAQDNERHGRLIDELSKIVHNMVVADQSAWIEWIHGKGAEAAMQRIANGLLGPGHIPAEGEPYSTEGQAWYDANRADAFPTCHCGRPANILHMGSGYCSEEHHVISTADQQKNVPE